MKKLLLIFVLLSLLINQTTLAYTLTKVDTKIANNKLNILNERIKKWFSYEIIYKQQLSLQNNIKKIRDSKNIKSIAYKNLDKNYTISQYILENLINYWTVKQNTVSNPLVKKQDTIIQEQTVVKKQNCDDWWYYNEWTMSCQPNNPVRSCNITNGTGKQTWNGNNWENCIVTSCNSWYSASNWSCLVNQPTQQTSPISNQITCSSDQHTENNTCVSNIKSCTVSNWIGQQSWNSDAWGNCNISSCNTGYSISGNSCIQNQPTCSSDQHIENNACISNTKSCTISNGIGQQSWDGNNWSNCIAYTCDNNYFLSDEKCIKNPPTCLVNQHIEENTCVWDIKNCSLSNWYGTQSWASGVWWNCTPIGCNAWYTKENNSCISNAWYISLFQDSIWNTFTNNLWLKNAAFIPRYTDSYKTIGIIKQWDTLNLKINTIHPQGKSILCYYAFMYEQGSSLNGSQLWTNSSSLTSCNSTLNIDKLIWNGRLLILRLIIKTWTLTNMDQLYTFWSGEDSFTIAYDIMQ